MRKEWGKVEVRIETGLQELRTIIVIQPPLEQSQHHDAQSVRKDEREM